MADLSVIIPAYNYADRLPRAINSVLSLPLSVELIVIDDGSTDNTASVARGLLESVGFFQFTSQENSGPAVARNNGIDMANSDYLMFLDADDEICPDGVSEALTFLKKNRACEVLITEHNSVSESKVKRVSFGELTDSPEDNFNNFLLKKKLRMSNGGMLIRRGSLGGIRFPESLRNSEDIPFFALLLAKLNVLGLNVPTVNVYKHSGSLRHNVELGLNSGLRIVDEVFNTTMLPKKFGKYKRKFQSQRCLSLFRTLYLAENYTEAINFYKLAIKSNRLAVFKLSYLRKFIKAYVRSYATKN